MPINIEPKKYKKEANNFLQRTVEVKDQLKMLTCQPHEAGVAAAAVEVNVKECAQENKEVMNKGEHPSQLDNCKK